LPVFSGAPEETVSDWEGLSAGGVEDGAGDSGAEGGTLAAGVPAQAVRVRIKARARIREANDFIAINLLLRYLR
jgi:hypothetical protein